MTLAVKEAFNPNTTNNQSFNCRVQRISEFLHVRLLLNDTDSGSENRDCDLKSFSEYFKTVNSQSADLNQHNLITDDNHENINPLINSEITQDEIEKSY